MEIEWYHLVGIFWIGAIVDRIVLIFEKRKQQ